MVASERQSDQTLEKHAALTEKTETESMKWHQETQRQGPLNHNIPFQKNMSTKFSIFKYPGNATKLI